MSRDTNWHEIKTKPFRPITFRPYASVLTDNGNIIEVYPNYYLLRKDLKRLYNMSINQQVIVTRYRRSAGLGRWVEKWSYKDEKLQIVSNSWK